jgi:hypothetical protein
MRDGGSLGEKLLPPSVPLLAVGAESSKKASLVPWLAV